MADLNLSERSGDGDLDLDVQTADLEDDSVTGAKVLDGTILNADVGAAAAVAWSKMAALTDGQLLVGSAANVATDVAMSGDATMVNTGAVTVTGSTGNFAVTGYLTQTRASLAGPGAVPVTTSLAEITTTGTGDAMTLADGTAGQRLSVIYVAEGAAGDTAVIAPVTLAGGTTITLNNLGDSADLVFSAVGGWYVLGLGGAAAVA